MVSVAPGRDVTWREIRGDLNRIDHPGGRVRVLDGVLTAPAAEEIDVRPWAAFRRVVARASVEKVCTGAAIQVVVTRLAFEGVVAVTPVELIVSGAAEQDVISWLAL